MSNIDGKIVSGRRIGRKIGFPTLNLPYSGDERGVFVVEASLANDVFKGVASIGRSPTFDVKDLLCEVFLFDFSKEVLSETYISIVLYDKIRDIIKFESVEDLKVQIAKDIEIAKNYFNLKHV